ncbi:MULTISPECIES: efflux transporter outer membrane subunit [unclassified Dysgonomonas]|uniref:efflux transporter outer membrane subunit n=1 Tax=unclassified Dysgonomonas TaxID=2630389 RepID=UPI0025BBFEB8|nr:MULTISPECIES: efflux transporter outer membrane subunit [unclassified Dysgonomonas]HMM01963.1 efflux transporter outer membrane subunit [Dysgonomonas sp.]
MISKQIKGAVLLGVILSMGFTSCGVLNSNKYKSPEVDASGMFRDENPTDTTTIANIPWREYFSDPVLQALIDEGLTNNYDLRLAYNRIQQAEAGLYIAKSAYFPTVALGAQVTHTQKSISNGKERVLGYNGGDQWALGFVVQWEADIWGKLNSKTKAQYANLVSTHAYRNLIQTSLVANIATTYYSLLALDEQLKITLETIELLKESTATMQAMMQAGLLNRAGVKQSEALLYSTQVSVPDLQMQINQLENSLSLLLGRKPGSISRTTIDNQSVPAELQVGIPAQMLAKRPDVLQAEMGFRYAFEMKNVAQRSLYPSLTLGSSSSVGFASNTLSQFFKPTNILANIVGGLTQPIFAGNQLRGQYKIAKAQQEEALLTFEQTVLTASQEVSNIMFTYETSLRKNEDRAKQVDALSLAVGDTQQLLKAGEANYTEVLQAEQSLLQAQLGQVSDKLEQLQASVNLYRALGGGIE